MLVIQLLVLSSSPRWLHVRLGGGGAGGQEDRRGHLLLPVWIDLCPRQPEVISTAPALSVKVPGDSLGIAVGGPSSGVHIIQVLKAE